MLYLTIILRICFGQLHDTLPQLGDTVRSGPLKHRGNAADALSYHCLGDIAQRL